MDIAVYGGLFISAFLAATIVPAQSEAVLLALTASGKYPVELLLMVASIGNVLGSILNWWLGCGIEHFRNKRWFPIKEKELVKAQDWYQRYGRWSLLLSWVPIIGDPITVAAGIMREKLWIFILLVTLSKTTRYFVIVYLAFK
jgi:membrane protein YqaA with SNARE-associated domain